MAQYRPQTSPKNSDKGTPTISTKLSLLLLSTLLALVIIFLKRRNQKKKPLRPSPPSMPRHLLEAMPHLMKVDRRDIGPLMNLMMTHHFPSPPEYSTGPNRRRSPTAQPTSPLDRTPRSKKKTRIPGSDGPKKQRTLDTMGFRSTS